MSPKTGYKLSLITAALGAIVLIWAPSKEQFMFVILMASLAVFFKRKI
jgi:hypothetical protein